MNMSVEKLGEYYKHTYRDSIEGHIYGNDQRSYRMDIGDIARLGIRRGISRDGAAIFVPPIRIGAGIDSRRIPHRQRRIPLDPHAHRRHCWKPHRIISQLLCSQKRGTRIYSTLR